MDVDALCAELLTWEGVPHHHQGRSRNGVDCIGLLIAALAARGVAVDAPANYARSAVGAMLLQCLDASPLVRRLPARAPLQPGDIAVFRIRRDAQHVAVVLSPDRMIHSTEPAGVRSVTISPLWAARLVCQYRWCHGSNPS